MKITGKTKQYLIGLLSVATARSAILTSIQPVYASANNPTFIDTIEENEIITNMNDLPMDLIEDVELAPFEEHEEKIVIDEVDFYAEVSLETGKIDFVDDEGNGIIVSIDDDDLEFRELRDGTVIFENEEAGYSVESQVVDGGFRKIFMIEDENSPKEYKIDIEMDETYQLEVDEDGLYYIANDQGEVIYIVGNPWAVDSLGDFIETEYQLRDGSLYQVVNYEGEHYPLQADPLFCSDTVNNTKTKWDSSYGNGKGTLRVYARTCAKVYITSTWVLGGTLGGVFGSSLIGKKMWGEVTADSDFKKHIASSRHARMRNQFICHAVNPSTIWKSSWNLEPWRPDVSLTKTYRALCNPK